MAAAKKHLVAIFAAAGLLALGGYAYYVNQAAPPAPQAPAGAPAPGKGGGPPGGFAIGVETVRVATSVFVDDVAAVGSLKSNESVVLRPEIAGRIAAIHLREGMPAAKGAVLVALDASTQAAELRQAEANLALSQANHRRTEELYEKKFVSARARDEAAANLKVLEAAVALAQARLQKTQIRAPFAGIVGIRNVSIGDYVKEGQELVNIEDIGALKADFRLPESYLSRLRKGQSVEVSTDAMPGQTFKGTLDAVDPLLDASGRAISLRARLENPDLKLRPGMFVRVRLAFGGERQGLAVPEEALVPAGDDNFVFRVVEGKAQRVMVKVGQRRGATVEITEGLKAGDEVVSAGQLKLRDGVPVRAGQGAAAPAEAKPASK
ncbi:Multidrug resistance protein MdtA [Rhodocyclaceae bacterium]|jgi:membrane fusion protein (multidrug efflux system)|nr:Multidrug resistance protein MdtA [Rhodocyclaceae bacterium]